MSCATCGHENPTGNRFCGGCGAPLERRCPACQHTNPPDHRFCGACGVALAESPESKVQSPLLGTSPSTTHEHESRSDPRSYTPKHLADKILQSKSALEACPEPGRRGERKQVTVLFADVKGSMELAEQVEKPPPITLVYEDVFAAIASGGHMIDTPRGIPHVKGASFGWPLRIRLLDCKI